MKLGTVVLPIVTLIALLVASCDREAPTAPGITTETTASFGKRIPLNEQTACYQSGMTAIEFAGVYGKATKALAKCDQNTEAQGPCEVEQDAHSDAWAALMTAYNDAVAVCGGGTEPPPENRPPYVTDIEVLPYSPTVSDGLRCQFGTYGDPDGDDVTLSYEWYVNDQLIGGETAIALGAGNVAIGDMVYCAATADDGQLTYREQSGNTVTIAEDPSYNVLDYLLVTEVLPNPQTASGDGEFIEVFNSANFAVDVSGVAVFGSVVPIELTGSIPAGAYCVYSDLDTTPGTCAVYPTLEFDDFDFDGLEVGLAANFLSGHILTYEYYLDLAPPGISIGLPILDPRASACEQVPTPGAANSPCQ